MIKDHIKKRITGSQVSYEGHGKLIASSNTIRATDAVICFTEAPMNKIAQIIASTNIDNMRNRPFGVMFEKDYLFEKGARPVVYQTEEEYKLLKNELIYRHVQVLRPHG